MFYFSLSVSAVPLSEELEGVLRVFDDPSTSDTLRAVAVSNGWELLARLKELEAPQDLEEYPDEEPARDGPAREPQGHVGEGGEGKCPEGGPQDQVLPLAVYALLGGQLALQLWVASIVTRGVSWRDITTRISAHCGSRAPAPSPTPTRGSGHGRSPVVPSVVVHRVPGLQPLHLSPVRVRSPARSCP